MPLLHLLVTQSTNDLAKHLSKEGCREGTCVLSEYQIAGKGRLGRRWEAPAGGGLLMSIVFRPKLALPEIHQLTMLSGLAIVDAVREETGLSARLKWPNDVLCRGAKLGGILAESALVGDAVEHCVVGIGLNVNAAPSLPDGLSMHRVTSLSEHVGGAVDRMSLLRRLLEALDRRYASLRAGQSPYAEWASAIAVEGANVLIVGGQDRWRGTAVGLDPDGAMLVRLPDGRIERVTSDDVVLQEEPGWRGAPTSDTMSGASSLA
ncbi:MAG TPA: biotin--[acetyl-CoA-carboxylase] ligase [Anaerolineae bacterium]|nr:biotin--[acetyl-CoA-carboxylase] ligase [Anaerolineae bacterium]